MPINKGIKKKIIEYLDSFLKPELKDLALPKPRIVHAIIGEEICGIGTIYNYYKMWRKTHLDDSRVYQHAVKYHVIEEDIYHEYKSIVPIL